MRMMLGNNGELARGLCCLHVAGRLSLVALVCFHLLVAAAGCADSSSSDPDESEVPSLAVEKLHDAIVEDDGERVVQVIQEYDLSLDSDEISRLAMELFVST